MYDLCHPSYYKISKLGSTDDTKITIAFYVYIELCEVKRLWDVEYKYNSDLDIIYIEGKKSKTSIPETYIPWPSLYKISLAQIENIQAALNIDRLIFAFRGGDSTTVYYRVTKGLVKPIPPGETKLIKEEENKKYELEQEIRRNTSILYEVAKSNIQSELQVTINENENGEELTDRTDEEKKEDANDVKQIQNIDQEKIKTTEDKKIQDTTNQEKIQDSRTEENLVQIDTDVEMLSV